MSPNSAFDPDRLNTEFAGRYVLGHELGAGGFATVYSATTAAGTAVAVKLIRPDRGASYAPKTVARFEREAELLSSLSNPHTVTLLEHGQVDGILFLAFEHVGGADLSTVLVRENTLSPQVAEHLLRQLLASLAEAHRAGLLHRDIKPENVRIGHREGDPWWLTLLDFGLARATDDSGPSVTATGELIGTPRYMSPEQLRGQRLTAASDVYSAGMLIFECLMGRAALHGNRWQDQLVRLHGDHEFEVPDAAAQTNPRLVEVIRKMTDPDPKRRYPSASVALAALDEVAAAPRADVSARSRRGLVAFAGIAVMGVALAIAAVFYADDEPTRLPPTPPGVPVGILKQSGAPSAPAIVPADVSVDVAADVADVSESGPTPGCGTEPPFEEYGVLVTSPNGRRNMVFVPQDYDPAKPYPVLVALHPLGYEPQKWGRDAGFADLARNEGVVVVLPIDSRVLKAWNGVGPSRLYKAIWTVAQGFCLDLGRLFVVGHAEGGGLANQMTCERHVNAVASSAHRPDVHVVECLPEMAKPYMLISPTDDGHTPFDGGKRCTRRVVRSVAEVEEQWITRNGCDGEAERTDLRGGVCFQWSGEASFRSCHIEGGHPWPGTGGRDTDVFGCDGEEPTFPSATEVWSFFGSRDPIPEDDWLSMEVDDW